MALMRSRPLTYLPVAVFVVLAVAFDYMGVAAVFAVGFDGVQRFLLSAICLIVGTVSAFVLTRPLVRHLSRR
jgi:hypothetical protein